MKEKEFLTIKDVAKIIGYKEGKAGNVIRFLNGELKEKGIEIFKGKISKKYFCERFNITLD